MYSLQKTDRSDVTTDCRFPAGVMVPEVSSSRCEAKGPCVDACPFDVLVVRPLTAPEKAALSPLRRLKLFMHGGEQAFVANPDACQGCGLCIQVCPERAITLKKR